MRLNSTPTLPTFRAPSALRKTTPLTRVPPYDFLLIRPMESGIFCEAGEDAFGPTPALRMIHLSKNGSVMLFYSILHTENVPRLYHFRITRVGEREFIRDELKEFQPVYSIIAESIQNQTAPAFPLFRHQPAPLRIPLSFSPIFQLVGSCNGLRIVNMKNLSQSYGPYAIIQSISIAEDCLEIQIDPSCQTPTLF